ncbi:MAG: histidine kinase [Bacteroidota bacterium]
MTKEEFIFSQTPRHRIIRHASFWLFFSLYIVLCRYYVYDLKYLSYASTYLIRVRNLWLFLPVAVFYAYFSIYFLIPNYLLKGRYKSMVLVLVLLSIGMVLLSYFVSTLVNIRLAWDIPLQRTSFVRKMDFTVNNGLVNPLMVSAFAIVIKMSKNFYLQQKQNELLAKQKIASEVKLLKSQVHPTFLFHSLKCIYTNMHNGSERSPAMLLKLSDLLSYILYESDEKLVPLGKELNLLQNYIELEKDYRGNNLTIISNNEIEKGTQLIAPLILLPLAEHVFEKAGREEQQLLLTSTMILKNDHFWFVLSMTGFASNENEVKEGDVQLEQVQKRLDTLYPGKHILKLETQEQRVTISLSIFLNSKHS